MSWSHAITETEFLAAVQHVAAILATKHKFGNHDTDDVQQMVAVYALEALPRYEPAKGNLEGFLFRHCGNRLLNFRRDELGHRTDAPCRVCYQHALGTGPGHDDDSMCPKFSEWWARRRTRANLSTPCSVDRVAGLEQEGAMWVDPQVPDATADQELLGIIDAHIPLDLRADFLRMRIGEPVPKVRRERVLEAARGILEDQSPSTAFKAPEPDDAFDDLDDCDE